MNNTDRQAKITRTAILGIVVNLFIAAVKLVIGFAVSSLAIVSEGINNATDVASSLLTLIGSKLSAKHPDEQHPFGYGRIEYLTGMLVGVIILYAGITMAFESVDGIVHPSEISVTKLTIVIVAFTAIVKLLLGVYTIKQGKSIDSDVLIAVGEDSRNDSMISLVTIVSALIFVIWGKSLDAYAGLILSVMVIKSGLEALKNTAAELIGRPGKKELAKELYNLIRNTEGVISVADMMLHNYGPDNYSGSVNIEIDHNKSIGEVYEIIHDLQLRIMHEYHVTMVFGMYAVDHDSPYIKDIRTDIVSFVRAEEYVKSFHALYLSESTSTIYVDFIVDYRLRDWDCVREKFIQYMAEKYAKYKIELTIETEFV